MLKKLFKYDMRSTARYWWICMCLTVGASIMVAISGRLIAECMAFLIYNEAFLYEILPAGLNVDTIYFFASFLALFAMLGIYGALILMSISLIITEVLVGVRFFKNLYTDEGYLTFTLPVSRNQILVSKFMSGMIFVVSQIAVVIVSIPIWFLVVPPSLALGEGLINPIVYEEVFSTLWESIGAWVIPWVLVFCIVAVLSVLSMAAYTIGVMYFSVTLGAVIVKKGKIFASLGCYYLINWLVGGAVSGISYFSVNGFSFFSGVAFLENAGTHGALALFALISFIGIAVYTTIAAVFYCGTRNLLERRLNLA